MVSSPLKLPKRGMFGTIITSIFTVLFILLLPITIVLVITAAIFRTLLKLHVKNFRPGFGKIMPLRSTLFTTEIPGEDSKNSLFHVFILKGSVDFNRLKDDILEKVNQKNDAGELKYPELQQSIKLVFGYSFWKWDRNFDINNHVYYGHHGSAKLTADEMNTFVQTNLLNPYPADKSPWEVFVFPQYQDRSGDGLERSAVLIRFNHALCDAFSVLYIMAAAAEITLPARASKNTGKDAGERLSSRLINILLAPYDLICGFYDTWDGRRLRVDEPRALVSRFSDPIPLSLIKNLKEKLGVSFGGILAAAYTGGLRKLAIENGIKVPSVLHAYTPLPMLGHEDKLRNKMKLGYLTLPVGFNDPMQRVKLAERHLKSLADSRLPSQVYYATGVVGLFPNLFAKIFRRYLALSGMITNFPFPLKSLEYNGHSVEYMMGAHGIFPRNVGISVTTASFKDSVIIQTNFIKSSVLNGNEEVFHNGILEEFKILADLASSAIKEVENI